MIEFILNDSVIKTEWSPGTSLLDFIRGEMGLCGTKIGCREGDCGACTVMLGELVNGRVKYKTIVSCLTPLANVQSKHVVSIEGLNHEQLSPIHQAIVDHSGTQCGFCTPGFVLSLFSHSLSEDTNDYKKMLVSIGGNICRCTGYKSIERAAHEIWRLNQARKDEEPVNWMVKNQYLPSYFSTIGDRLAVIKSSDQTIPEKVVIIGGGTDLMVTGADELAEADPILLVAKKISKEILFKKDQCFIGAAASASEIMDSDEMQRCIPKIEDHFKLISSTQIRNMGTLGGNIINASPIGDLIIYFLALDAMLSIGNSDGEHREVPLKDFYLGYKQMNIRGEEFVKGLRFKYPVEGQVFNFEKVSKREHLDIASVNSAISLRVDNNLIDTIHLAVGGVAPIPLYLRKTCDFLKGREPDSESLVQANRIMQDEISPISDIRGSEQYKRLLLRQLFFAHFIELFPGRFNLELLAKSNAQ